MQFIRNNLFYVALLAGCVLGAAGLLAFGFNVGGEVDQAQGLRETLGGKLAALGREPFVNERVLETKRRNVAEIRRQAAELADKNIRWNRKNFSVYDAEEFIATITQHIPKKSF